nr:neurofilament medium polypeptide-like [Malus domestica]
MLLQDGRFDSYTENFKVEDNKEAADPRVVAIAVVIKEIVLTEALKELKVLFEWLAHEKEISNKNLVKKVEELSNVVEELRRVVMEKPVEENTKEEDEGKKDVGEKVEEDGEDEEEGEEEKK